MSTIAKENLDERIERIKKRNEEIEKKYREAEEDRLRALKENAMVETKPPKDEDWPRTHKYDKIDFMYDVKPEKLENLNNPKLTDEKKQKRDYKKFADGEGPPPDPAYNFLADAERDGLVIQRSEKGGKEKDAKTNSNNKNKDQQNRRGGPNTGSFRGRGGKATQSPKYQKQNSQPDYEQWRSEREKIDEARISRQKVGEGKWRREWDNDKLNSENEALLRPERATLSDAIIGARKSPTHQHNNAATEKRGNITVSVSQTGEVKSVKLTSAPAIGTGRVGPRQISKPQFSIQAIEKEVIAAKAPHSPKPQQKVVNRPNLNHAQPTKSLNRRDTTSAVVVVNADQVVANPQGSYPAKNTKQHKPKPAKFAPLTLTPGVPASIPLIADLTPPNASDLIAIDLSHKPEFAKKSVQDRLIRIRQATNANEIVLNSANGDINNFANSPEIVSEDNKVPLDVKIGDADAVPVKLNNVADSGTTTNSGEILSSDKNANVEKLESLLAGEAKKTSAESNNTSDNTAVQPDGEDSKANCDKNSNESIVPITVAAEAIAAN